jgi:hypothetical protein
MRTLSTSALGLCAGAGLAYFLDPVSGRRRRSLVRDKATRARNKLEDGLSAAGRDIANRSRGLLAELRRFFSAGEPSDDVLESRVRSILGRHSSHPRALDVRVRNGDVKLKGPILVDEVQGVVSSVRSLEGVHGVENELEVHSSPDVPALQGPDGRHASRSRFDILQVHWGPGTRLLAGAAGGVLLAYGASRKAPEACTLGTIGLALVVRALTNQPLTSLMGLDPPR